MARKIEIPNLDNLIEMYISGVSMNELFKQFGIGRNVLTANFKKRGIQIRGNSDAEKIKWGKMSPTQRKRQVQKAHQAVRGTKHSIETKVMAAKSFYQKCLRSGAFEPELAEIINKHFACSRQVAVGFYNMDIALHELPIAIEVQMSNRSKLLEPKGLSRIKYILDKGFLVIYVINLANEVPETIDLFSITHKIIAYINKARLDKTMFGKYIMIGSDGNPLPTDRYNFPNHTRIE
jgi:very-short-patch-repair endonuclease